MANSKYKIMARHYMDWIYEEWDGELYDSYDEAYKELSNCLSTSWVEDAYIKEV